jgi:hypothetical protein
MPLCGQPTTRGGTCRLPAERCTYHGGGLLPEPRKGAPPAVRKWLKEHGEERVLTLWVGREPVNLLVQRFLDVITRGKLTEAKRRLQYEQLFHVWLEIKLSGGESFRLEKNEVVSVKPLSEKALDKDERMRVPVVRALSAADMLEHAELLQQMEAERGDFWGYDHRVNNCQMFVADVLQANPALKKSAELTDFYRQDAGEIDRELGHVASRLGQNATQLAARIHRVRFGAGLQRPRLVRAHRGDAC